MNIPAYWERTYDVYKDTYLQELYSEELLGFWGAWDTSSSILVAATATGSTIAGFWLWSTDSGKVAWGIISGIAATASLLNAGLKVPQRVKEQGELWSAFLHLRLQLEAFRQDMPGMSESDQKTRCETLRDAYQQLMDKSKLD